MEQILDKLGGLSFGWMSWLFADTGHCPSVAYSGP